MSALIKNTTTTRTGTDIATADPELAATLQANKAYMVRGRIWYGASATGGFSIGLSCGPGPVYFNGFCRRSIMEALPSNAFGNQFSGAYNLTALSTTRSLGGSDTPNTRNFFEFNVMVFVGGADSVLSVIWAQQTSHASNAVLYAGSTMEWEEVGPLAIFKTADESRPTAAMADDSQLTLALAASTDYWLDAGMLCQVTQDFAKQIRFSYVYTGTITDSWLNLDFARIIAVTSMGGNYSNRNIYRNTLPTDSAIDPDSASTAARGMAMLRGRFKTNAAGNFKLQWRKTDNGGAPGVLGTVFEGSFITARPIVLA